MRLFHVFANSKLERDLPNYVVVKGVEVDEPVRVRGEVLGLILGNFTENNRKLDQVVRVV